MNLPRSASRRIASRRARLGTLAAQPRKQIHLVAPAKRIAHTRKRSRVGLLLLVASALFFTYVLLV